MSYKTGNPALNENSFTKIASVEGAEPMTLEGTADKTLILLAVLVFSAAVTWMQVRNADIGDWVDGTSVGFGASLVGLGLAVAVVWKPERAPHLAPIYAAVEGIVIGAWSAFFNHVYPGIVLQAVAITFGVLATMLVLYATRVIKVTEHLRMGIVAATGGIVAVYLATFLLGLLGMHVPYIHDGGRAGIMFSLLVVGIAAFNLVLDFDFIETGVQRRVPKYMEWYGAFGLIVTLIWLYFEILRLLAKSRKR
jgi:uncharacterized YccA/Bax inhibitor family protein